MVLKEFHSTAIAFLLVIIMPAGIFAYIYENPDYIRGLLPFHYHITYHFLHMLKVKHDINQQDLNMIALHFVKSD